MVIVLQPPDNVTAASSTSVAKQSTDPGLYHVPLHLVMFHLPPPSKRLDPSMCSLPLYRESPLHRIAGEYALMVQTQSQTSDVPEQMSSLVDPRGIRHHPLRMIAVCDLWDNILCTDR